MEERKDFIKIRVGVLIDPNKHLVFQDGKLSWKEEHLNEFYEADAKLRDPIITFINEEVGEYNWGIRFQPFYTGEYEVYIYCPTDEDFHKIVSIIQERIKGERFRLFQKQGKVDDYLADR